MDTEPGASSGESASGVGEATVLHVDDEPGFSEMAATFLERECEELTVVPATSAAEAIERLRSGGIDCVVSDYDMPGRSGLDLLRVVREEFGQLPFILFTGKGSEEVASEAISAGVSEYLQKTSGLDQYTVLANRIENLVRLHRAETRLARNGDRTGDSVDLLGDPADRPDEVAGRPDEKTPAVDSDAASRTDAGSDDEASFHTASGADETVDGRERAFDALAEASADGIIMLDDESTIRYANPAVERILGYTRADLVGSSKMKIIPERLRQEHAEAFQRYLTTGTKHIDWTYVELPGLHSDGHELPLAISFNDFEHDGDRYFVGTFRDISERKRAERELQRQNERLDEFASIVSHDLKSPLNVVQGNLDLLREDYGPDGRIDAGLSALDRIESITEDTLTLAREGVVVDADAMTVVDLAAEAERCWQTVEADDASLDVETTIEFSADPDRLFHVLQNLFQNAVEHGDSSVSIRVGALPDDAGFYVEDDGPGVPERDRDSVFDAGFTTETNGTGFGLSIVERIAGAHDWDVRLVESDPGGARFEFTGIDQ